MTEHITDGRHVYEIGYEKGVIKAKLLMKERLTGKVIVSSMCNNWG